VQVGDTVIYSKYGGTEFKLEGDTVVILDEDQIYAVKTA
jgi:co-chaperonin GroES (HSP10)